MNTYTPEIQSLVLLCRPEVQVGELRESIGTIQEWERFVHLAGQHGIIAMCRQRIWQAGLEELLPAKAKEELNKHYYYQLSRGGILREQLLPVLELLASARIPCMLLKGMALEHSVYEGQGIRQMNDADLLVPRTQALEAWQLLQKNDFEAYPLKSPLYRKLLLHMGKHLPTLWRDDLHIDMHYALFPRETEKLHDSLWHQAGEVLIGGVPALLPSRPHHLAFLCAHLAHHEAAGDSQLRLHADLLYMLKEMTEAEIRQTLEIASATRCRPETEQLLGRLARIWKLPFPADLLPREDREEQRRFLRFLENPKNNPHSRLRSYAENLHRIEGLGRRLRFLLGDLFPSLAFMHSRYPKVPSALIPFLYPLRLGKLLYFALSVFYK